jgi:hypothetical protein
MSGDPEADLAAARNRVASLMRGAGPAVDAHLGSLTLRPHQQDAAIRLREIMERYRGALLADAVGLGKTYVALAIARQHDNPLVICPAALRAMWERAIATAGLAIPIVSVEALSRGEPPPGRPDLLVIDEAHHLRTPTTRRYAVVAALARHARVLLMSATPMHNSRRDLDALVALFAGSGARAWPEAKVARLIVRRDAASTRQVLPSIDGPHSLVPATDDDCLDDILAIPPPIPAADEGTARALATISLLHLWSSSRGALLASARRRRGRAVALRDAVASGHLPTARELAAWLYADDAVQLAFPFCVSDEHTIDGPELHSRLDMHILHVGRLISRCRETPDPDLSRVQLIRRLRETHRAARIVAFSQYAQTVLTLGRLMREDPGVAVITGEGGHIAAGSITRAGILAQFAGDAPPAREIERIGLLLTTDLLSEGIDLRGASVIVHLDLPWNPARLEQRVGRARRLGSPHDSIHVYTFLPPAAAERTLELQRRLRAKVRSANDMIGGMEHPLAGIASASATTSSVAAAETLRARISAWLDPAARASEATLVAAASSPRRGWVAVVIVDGLPRLLSSGAGQVTDDPADCMELVDLVGDAAMVDEDRAAEILSSIRTWLASRNALAELGEQSSPRRAVLDRLAHVVARSPRHRRAGMLAVAQRAGDRIAALTGAGVERALATLAKSAMEDEEWVQSVDAFATAGGSRPGAAPAATAIPALILLG